MVKDRNRDVDEELIAKGREAERDFDASEEYTVRPKRSSSKLISLRLPVEILEELRIAAETKGHRGYQTLIKDYIVDGLLRQRNAGSTGVEFPVSSGNSGTEEIVHFRIVSVTGEEHEPYTYSTGKEGAKYGR